MAIKDLKLPDGPMSGLVASAVEYMVDAGQRSVLFLDIMRQRGDQYREHVAQTAPHVLQYAAELITDGRKLDEPVNYALVRIIPPKDVEIDMSRRPFVVVDPRAGHGPGIGGFKADSEIGVAMKAGHPCYFIGFLPEPMPGQTIERIARAEAIFIETVISRHPDADGKPCVIGNCQAGWAVMILASLRPELFGPLIIAGAPLAYWAGVHGKYPMRYSGGLLGGSWLTALTSDLGAGKFDGAWLVQNFENQNPSTSTPRSIPRRNAISISSAGGADMSISMPRKSSSSSTNSSSATISQPARSRCPMARRSICATFARRSLCSAPRATTSPRRSRRWTGSWTATPTSTRSELMARPSSIPFTRASAISASSYPAVWRRRSTLSSPATST
ncbi:pimeloyl-ACP methyl ester carboxylesterase [Bradyrhizobium barranii subsp. barranii]